MSAGLRIETIADLENVKKTFKEKVSQYKYRVLICSGTGCTSANCGAVKDAMIKALEENNILDQVLISVTGCRGSCALGPLMEVLPDEVLYTKLDPEDMPRIISEHFVKGKPVEDKTYYDVALDKYISNIKDINFYNKQERVVLKNCGMVDCHSIEDYISKDGYFAAYKVLTGMQPIDVVNEMKVSGLKGRGGAGFPTGVKWESGMKAPSGEKYLICNGDEGDPGAFMDRSVLESVPHAVIEGMIIGGYAIGSKKGYAYIRAEYDLAVERFGTAIDAARKSGILGKNIFGTDFEFDIEIRIGAGAFVCGEETALISSVQGRRGEPMPKPPFPFQKGLFGKPSIINNVETLANVPAIILNGGAWFAQFGTEGSKGTKVFALAGNIVNTGLIEVPMGETLGNIIYDIGGGIPKGKKFKAAQTGGPSGGCLAKQHLNTKMDYQSLAELGAIMGSGGMIVMDEDSCMVDVARFFMEFVQDESCGKCVACRIGTRRMLDILERICGGQGEKGDIEKLIELAETVRSTALCGLGQTAPNPILSTIKYFREEYEEHINNKFCSAGVCSEMFAAPCQNACPANVNAAGYVALIAAGRAVDAYNLVRQENPFPAICGRVCTHPCERKCRRQTLDESIDIVSLKRYAADVALNNDKLIDLKTSPKKGKSVAVIGGGPSGLTCAYYLARTGYDVTVFEANDVAGGMLTVGIPAYRLPKDVVAHEIDLIRQVGVEIKTGIEVGKDISFDEIRNQYDAVYFATGTQFSRKLDVEGEIMPGVYHGLDFLRDVNLGRDVKVSGVAAVIGGGNTAIDAARTALRLGASEVHILYRRSIEDMPADKREIDEAIEEGIFIHELVAPVSLTGNGKVEKVICQKMILKGFDKEGRRKPVVVEGEIAEFKADLVIPAVSQYSDLPFLSQGDIPLTSWGTIIVDKDTQKTSVPGIFAGGDVARGADVAITAIADGKKAAQSIDIYLGGKGELNKGEPIEIPQDVDESELVEHDRYLPKCMSAELRKDSFEEVAKGYHRIDAIAEAMRCLRCDRR